MVEHEPEPLARHVARRLAVDGVAEIHVVGRDGLRDGARRAAGLKEHAGDLLARADFGEGAVFEVVEVDGERLGVRREHVFFLAHDHIIIKHSDGGEAMYWHLKKDGVLVNVGDTVKQGQHIGYSGNTGYTAFPHLHFQVYNADGKNIATRFVTKKGAIYLRPGKYYKAIN